MGDLIQDVRYGIRMLLKRPVFTIITVLTLALGIGANSAIFSVVNAVLLRPFPFQEPDRLAYIEGMDLRDGSKGGALSPPDFLDFREQSRSFERLAAFQPASLTLTGEGSESERITAARVTSNYFETLGVAPIAGGRSFLPEEEQGVSPSVVIISHGLWQRRFGSDPKIVGKSLLLNGQSLNVVGVTPAEFQYPKDTDLWVPLSFKADAMSARRFHSLTGIGRLKPGVTLNQAQSEMLTIAHQLEQQYPDTNKNNAAALTLLPDRIIGEMRRTLLILASAVGLVLLIACANVANLSLARGASRYREISIRASLGASRSRIVRQLLTESVVLALIGGALGLLLAVWGVGILISLSPANLPRLSEVTTDWRVLGFTLLISLLTGVLFGLIPALASSKTNLTEALKDGSRGGTSSSSQRLRSLLVISEVALSLVLLIAAGLFIRSFLRLSQVDLGIKPTNVLTMQLSLTRAKYPDAKQRADFFNQLIQRLESLPGAQAAGTISELPLSGQENDTFFNIEGAPSVSFGSLENNANIRTVSPDYFSALGIPVVKGRPFSERDTLDSPKAIIVSEAFVRKYFPGEDPLGKRLTIDFGAPWTGEIVGVVGNVRHSNPAQGPYPEMYVNQGQNPPFGVNLVVRAAGGPSQLTAAIRNEIHSLDKDLPVYNVKTMEQHVTDATAQPRFRTLLLGIFAALALVLASIGIYGVISYSVTQRTHEIGLRVALGAQRGDVFKLVVGQAMRLALIGVGIGLIGAFVLTRLMSSFLFGISATDPLTFSGITLLLIAVAFLACYLPARRATKVDPMIALRYE